MTRRVSQGDWGKLGESARSVRDAVFIGEQGIPEHLEHDEHDEFLHHIVVFVNVSPVATGRLDENGKIGRVAVLHQYRKKGFGKIVMEGLEARAQSVGVNKVFIHAQSEVIPFYVRLGYLASGDAFFEAKISHQRMTKYLK